MSKDIIVLTPNGRRQKVRCTPDTSILQVGMNYVQYENLFFNIFELYERVIPIII